MSSCTPLLPALATTRHWQYIAQIYTPITLLAGSRISIKVKQLRLQFDEKMARKLTVKTFLHPCRNTVCLKNKDESDMCFVMVSMCLVFV